MATIERHINDAKSYFKQWLWRDAITRLITVNFIMWVIVAAGALFSDSPGRWIGYFSVPPAEYLVPWRIYTVLTYMFVHYDFLHLFANMLWLMLFGRMFEIYQSGARLFALYIYGGLAGAGAFLICNVLGVTAHSGLLGASCSVLAIIGAVMIQSPSWRVNLLLLGQVKIIWVGLAAVLFFIVLAPTFDECAAHAAGLCTGALYALLRQRGLDMATPIVRLLSRRRQPRSGPETRRGDDNEMLDALLAKVSRSGYASLTAHERQQLFEISMRIKK